MFNPHIPEVNSLETISQFYTSMNTFENNILSIYGEKGRAWLDELPKTIHQLKRQWNLSQLKPLDNLTYNYVLSGHQDNIPIILKLSLDSLGLNREATALNNFKKFGAVTVLDQTENALLLQRACPGHSLKASQEQNGKMRIEIACDVAKRLHQAPLSKGIDFPYITDWLETLDKESKIPNSHLQLARLLKKELLATTIESLVLLHGDLHQNNILSHEAGWLVIDPKGVIGFPINELWACVEDLNYDLKFISSYFEYPFEKVAKWYYVHLILAACWQVEDNLDASLFLKLANIVLPMIKDS